MVNLYVERVPSFKFNVRQVWPACSMKTGSRKQELSNAWFLEVAALVLRNSTSAGGRAWVLDA